MGYVMGLEFGREYLMTCIVDATGQLVHSQRVNKVPPFKPHDATFDELIETVFQVASDARIAWDDVKALGLALHGVVSADGTWFIWEQAEQQYPARQRFADKLDRLIYVEDVSRAFAEAEHRFGAGVNVPDMIYVFVGSRGIGAGIFVNGVLLKNTSGICGELGHIIVDANGALCQCGNRGCLETVATHDAVLQRLRNRLRKGVISCLVDDDALTFAQLCQATDAGDKEATIALGELAGYVAGALAGTVNIVGATLILIGGQLRLAGNGFIAELGSALRQQLVPALAPRLQVGYAMLPAYAGAWGVAAQALDAAWADNCLVQAADRPIAEAL
jgi:predicted NBD/HSP70 family sugar kinase